MTRPDGQPEDEAQDQAATRAAVQERYVEDGFTAAMLCAIPDDEEF
jgi:hypothetical protein